MRLLVLGGTAPLGRAVARTARDAGHDVTCLARGSSGPVPAGVRLVVADRTVAGAYDEVAGLDWDEVLDVTRQPGLARSALAALAPRAAHWTYVSSCSVYAADDEPGADETAAVQPALPADVQSAGPERYGAAKLTCELAAAQVLGDRLHVSRAGLLGGPEDTTDRVGYWPARFARGGDVLVPGGASAYPQHAQVLDLRDYAAFLVTAAERGEVGTMNAVGESVALETALGFAREVAGDGSPVLVDDSWLVEQGVEPWMGPESLPLWLPDPAYAGHQRRSDARAVASGLRRRPLGWTLADTLADERERGLDRPRAAGLSPHREGELLRRWAALT